MICSILLLSQIFSNYVLKGDKLEPNYTLVGEFIAYWLNQLKNTFEPAKLSLNKGKAESFDSAHPTWLPRLDAFRTVNWNDIIRDMKILFSDSLAYT